MNLLSFPFLVNILFLLAVVLYLLKKTGSKNIVKTKSFKPVIDKFTIDLTRLARDGKLDPVVGRDQEIKRVIQVLSRRKKNNVILHGKAGIGKTAIAEGLATAIVEGRVPSSLLDKKLIHLQCVHNTLFHLH